MCQVGVTCKFEIFHLGKIPAHLSNSCFPVIHKTFMSSWLCFIIYILYLSSFCPQYWNWVIYQIHPKYSYSQSYSLSCYLVLKHLYLKIKRKLKKKQNLLYTEKIHLESEEDIYLTSKHVLKI